MAELVFFSCFQHYSCDSNLMIGSFLEPLTESNPYFARGDTGTLCVHLFFYFTNHSAMNNPLRSNVAIAACCHLTVPGHGQTQITSKHLHKTSHCFLLDMKNKIMKKPNNSENTLKDLH